MKKLLVLLLMTGCFQEELKKPMVIVNKHNTDYYGEPLKIGWCRFWYSRSGTMQRSIEFTDSCKCYSIGDTILGTIKNSSK